MATKEELMEVARELDIPGRSGMSKEELQDAIADYSEVEESDNGDLTVEGDTVRIIAGRWNRFLVERNDRPSEGEADLLRQVVIMGKTAIMPLAVAQAFGVHPSFYEA